MFPQEGETVPKVRFKGFEGEWEKIPFGSFLKESYERSTVENEDILLSSAITGVYLNSELFGHQRGASNIGYKKIKKNMLILSTQNLHLGNANVNLRFEHGLISPAYKVYEIVNISPLFLQQWIKMDSTKVAMAFGGCFRYVVFAKQASAGMRPRKERSTQYGKHPKTGKQLSHRGLHGLRLQRRAYQVPAENRPSTPGADTKAEGEVAPGAGGALRALLPGCPGGNCKAHHPGRLHQSVAAGDRPRQTGQVHHPPGPAGHRPHPPRSGPLQAHGAAAGALPGILRPTP